MSHYVFLCSSPKTEYKSTATKRAILTTAWYIDTGNHEFQARGTSQTRRTDRQVEHRDGWRHKRKCSLSRDALLPNKVWTTQTNSATTATEAWRRLYQPLYMQRHTRPLGTWQRHRNRSVYFNSFEIFSTSLSFLTVQTTPHLFVAVWQELLSCPCHSFLVQDRWETTSPK